MSNLCALYLSLTSQLAVIRITILHHAHCRLLIVNGVHLFLWTLVAGMKLASLSILHFSIKMRK